MLLSSFQILLTCLWQKINCTCIENFFKRARVLAALDPSPNVFLSVHRFKKIPEYWHVIWSNQKNKILYDFEFAQCDETTGIGHTSHCSVFEESEIYPAISAASSARNAPLLIFGESKALKLILLVHLSLCGFDEQLFSDTRKSRFHRNFTSLQQSEPTWARLASLTRILQARVEKSQPFRELRTLKNCPFLGRKKSQKFAIS